MAKLWLELMSRTITPAGAMAPCVPADAAILKVACIGRMPITATGSGWLSPSTSISSRTSCTLLGAGDVAIALTTTTPVSAGATEICPVTGVPGESPLSVRMVLAASVLASRGRGNNTERRQPAVRHGSNADVAVGRCLDQFAVRLGYAAIRGVGDGRLVTGENAHVERRVDVHLRRAV